MKIVLLLTLACTAAVLSAPSPDAPVRQEQKPATENYSNQFNQNPMNSGWMLGNGGSWPNFGQMASKQPVLPFSAGFGTIPRMDGVETIEASAGMSCSFQNGKKKCTNQNHSKVKY